MSPSGDLTLDPALVLAASTRLPSSPGPYRLEGSGTNGERLFRLNFALDRVDHGGGSFLFTIPFDDRWTPALGRVVLSGPEGVAVLDGASDAPMALVMDRATGRVTAILRGEDAVRSAASSITAAVGAAPPTDILVSYGLPAKHRPLPRPLGLDPMAGEWVRVDSVNYLGDLVVREVAPDSEPRLRLGYRGGSHGPGWS